MTSSIQNGHKPTPPPDKSSSSWKLIDLDPLTNRILEVVTPAMNQLLRDVHEMKDKAVGSLSKLDPISERLDKLTSLAEPWLEIQLRKKAQKAEKSDALAPPLPINLFPDNKNIPETAKELIGYLNAHVQLPTFVINNIADWVLLALKFVAKTGSSAIEKNCIDLFARMALEAKNSGSQEQLTGALFGFFNFINDPQIRLNGATLPRFGSVKEPMELEEEFAEIAEAAAEARKAQQAPVLDLAGKRAKTNQEKERLVKNVTEFITLKTVYETVCGLKTPQNEDAFYYQLMTERTGDLKSRFFHKIKEAKVSFFRRGLAHVAFVILRSLSQSIISAFTSNFLTAIRKKLNALGKEEALVNAGEEAIGNFTDYLETISNSLRRIAKDNHRSQRISKSLENELGTPECNEGYTNEELYKEVGEKFIDEFGFRASKKRNIVIRAILFIPSFFFNFFTTFLLKRIVQKTEVVQSLVDTSLGALKKKNGYTHTLNKALCHQLEKVQTLLLLRNEQKKLERKIELGERKLLCNPQDEEKKLCQEELSIQKKKLAELLSDENRRKLAPPIKLDGNEVLRPLVEKIFEVLDETDIKTQSKLISYFDEGATIDKVADFPGRLIDAVALPRATDAIIKVINLAYGEFMKEESLEEQIGSSLEQLNGIFTHAENKGVDFEAEYAALEDKIKKHSHTILKILINDAVEEHFDFKATWEQRASNEFVRDLKGIILGSDEDEGFLQRMRKNLAHRSGNPSQVLDHLNRDLENFARKCQSKTLQMQGNEHLRLPMVNALQSTIKELSDHTKNLAELILASMQDNQSHAQEIEDSLQKMEVWAEGIKELLIYNFELPKIDGLQDFALDRIYGRIRLKMDRFLNFIRKPHNYRYGIFHRMVFIPFVKS